MGQVRIVISIPVHEKPEVVNDQVRNFQKFIPGVILVVHVSYDFLREHPISEIKQVEGLYINPEHLDTAWGDILQAHLSNFHYISEQIDFDYFVLHASNDMYIRKGLADYIERFDAGFQFHEISRKGSLWWPGDIAIEDEQLRKIMEACGQKTIIATQVEGSFYKKELMEKIVSIISRVYNPREQRDSYTREECYFSTVAASLTERDHVGFPTTFSEVHRFDRVEWKIQRFLMLIYRGSKLDRVIPFCWYHRGRMKYIRYLMIARFYRTTPKVVKKVLTNEREYISKNSFLDDGFGRYRLYDGNLFSVKRVARKMDDPVRQFIMQLEPH